MDAISQAPAPGEHILAFAGDTILFRLSLSRPVKGRAWLRTSINHGAITRREIIREVEHDEPPLSRDWFDVPMKRVDDTTWEVVLGLWEVGHFLAKTYFIPDGHITPVWPHGENTGVNVSPADTVCANTLYNAFVRQFGPNKGGGGGVGEDLRSSIDELDNLGWVVIPPSGTFRDLGRELDHIVGALGCRYVQLLPVHPTPTTYARMGRFGSPFAALSFTNVDAGLADFDPRATPLEQFVELLDAVHTRGAKVLLDIAINHTGWAAQLHETHPEWLVRDEHGRIQVPGAWGVVWSDLTKLDYSHRDLWVYMAEVFRTWCRRGVDGFRCDAGYMLPVEAWRYIVASVREQYPETVFLLEGLGGKTSVTRRILNEANFDWGYSELFQNHDRDAIEWYLPTAYEIGGSEGTLVNFAETHDNNRLAERGKPWARMRCALCALASQNGAFGFANGVEWFATEKIDVHQSPSLNWGAEDNQISLLRRLNLILARHPAYQGGTRLSLLDCGPVNALAVLRHHVPTDSHLLVLVNLDDREPAWVTWTAGQTNMGSPEYFDLVTDDMVDVVFRDGRFSTQLPPAGFVCLTAEREDLDIVSDPGGPLFDPPPRVRHQRLRAKALEVHSHFFPDSDVSGLRPDRMAESLGLDPAAFCRDASADGLPHTTLWQWPGDRRREVMVPPGHFLLVCAPAPFRVRLRRDRDVILEERSLPRRDGTHFALFVRCPPPGANQERMLEVSLYSPDGCEHVEAPVLFLGEPENAVVRRVFGRRELFDNDVLLLDTNGRGGMTRVPARWGELWSKYDGLLAANLDPGVPEDRWIMFTRCRAWLVYQGYSQEIRNECLESFCHGDSGEGMWRFLVPSGQGQHVTLTVRVAMERERNAVRMVFFRETADGAGDRLEDDRSIRLILRPHVDDRSFHANTKAFNGLEDKWPAAVRPLDNGFVFAPAVGRRLHCAMAPGVYHHEPEWHYMHHFPWEASRGHDPHNDLFSPGYLAADLAGGQGAELVAEVLTSTESGPSALPAAGGRPVALAADCFEAPPLPLDEAMERAMEHYVVRRDQSKTVIAGYPWFLDWGRDSLIFLRGLAASGRHGDTRLILRQFAMFEDQGTLPNMIRGKDARDRHTSDAPLWFAVACSDLLRAEGSDSFLDEECAGRSIREVLLSIVRGYAAGAPNGVAMDPESGLVHSPSHYTWMDTNFPAGTPREGYPVEIQALWHAALTFAGRVDPEEGEKWKNLAATVRKALMDFFYKEKTGHFSDCLHAPPGTPAAEAVADNALRPNQLLALTLGAVDDTAAMEATLASCGELLVPGAIRSLADRPVSPPLAVERDGRLLNNPDRPYQGRYTGDEDTRRKPAYHNGTAWTWMYPSYAEAWAMVHGPASHRTALAWLAGGLRYVETGATGHTPEIMDGDAPHVYRGCDAQAWGAGELYRVWKKLGG